MKLTTGYEFQGYFITEYLDVIFDEMLVGLGFGKSLVAGIDNIVSSLAGTEATEMVDKLNAVKTNLRERVISKAKALGANALIGIDFESSKLGDMIMVSMTATAVKIDKIISPLPYTQTQQLQIEETAKREQEAEEKRQRLEYIRDHRNGFDKETFWNILNEYQTSKEMVEFIQQTATEHPGIFSDEILATLDKYLRIERMYGKGSSRKDILTIIKRQLGL